MSTYADPWRNAWAELGEWLNQKWRSDTERAVANNDSVYFQSAADTSAVVRQHMQKIAPKAISPAEDWDQAIRSHAVWMAKLARGSSWPGEMAHAVEDAAVRVIREYGTDADRAAIEATS